MSIERITDPLRAAALLKAGKLVAFPTETVYGLGVDATNAESVQRLFHVKGRPGNNPLIVHVASLMQADLAARHWPPAAHRLLARFAPGPITVVVPKRTAIVSEVTAGLDTVGIRIPDHPLALRMLEALTIPIAAPSANRSGRPSATSWQAVMEDFGDTIDGVLVGDAPRVGLESTVVDCLSDPPRMLRPGGLTLDMLRMVVPGVVMAGAIAQAGENSPGRLHPHYRPRARVELFDLPQQVIASEEAAYVGIDAHEAAGSFGLCESFASHDDYARRLYEVLREVDRRGLSVVYLQTVEPIGIGLALSDRIKRAAEK